MPIDNANPQYQAFALAIWIARLDRQVESAIDLEYLHRQPLNSLIGTNHN